MTFEIVKRGGIGWPVLKNLRMRMEEVDVHTRKKNARVKGKEVASPNVFTLRWSGTVQG